MKLTSREAAQLLQISERTVHRWVQNLGMPHMDTPEGKLFDREELIQWADKHSFRIAMEVPGEQSSPLPLLAPTIQAGGIHYDVPGDCVEDALGEIAYGMNLPDLVDREFFHQVLLTREDLGSTGIGDGVAVPHVRSPLVIHVESPLVGLFFLKNAIAWNSIDGKPVKNLFTVVSPGIRAHLHLLSRISFALRSGELRKLLDLRKSSEVIMAKLGALDAQMTVP